MATVTKTIGTSGRDYSTIAAWEADLSDRGQTKEQIRANIMRHKK